MRTISSLTSDRRSIVLTSAREPSAPTKVNATTKLSAKCPTSTASRKPELALTIGGLELAVLQRVDELLVGFHDFEARPA